MHGRNASSARRPLPACLQYVNSFDFDSDSACGLNGTTSLHLIYSDSINAMIQRLSIACPACQPLSALLLPLLMTLICSECLADFIVVSEGSGVPAKISRVRDDGQIIKTFDLPQITSGEFALGGLGPDGNLYVLKNDYPTVRIVRIDPMSGQLLDEPQTPFTGSNKIPGLVSAHRLAFAPNGDLFVLGSAGADPGGSEYGVSVVHRIDVTTGLSQSSYSEVEPYGFSDLAVRPSTAGGEYDAEVFITEGYGWISRWHSSDADESIPGSPMANSPIGVQSIGQSPARYMNFGPDGRLYFRTDLDRIWAVDVETGVGEMIVDSMPNPFLPSVDSLGGNVTFGPNGDLFLTLSGVYGFLWDWHNVTYQFDGESGELMGTAFGAFDSEFGEIADLIYLPVPEPAAWPLAAIGISSVLWIVRQKRSRREDSGRTH